MSPLAAVLWLWLSPDCLLPSLAAAEEGLDGWLALLADELLLVLPAELLELLIGGGLGADVCGGVCGCVGLLAVGQPDRKRQRQTAAPMR
ncbi:MAG: hypothetical protein P8J79_02945 [Halioglobus sp.]|nr:hypothetical protein [Halioglobus sp.]